MPAGTCATFEQATQRSAFWQTHMRMLSQSGQVLHDSSTARLQDSLFFSNQMELGKGRQLSLCILDPNSKNQDLKH